MKTLFKSLGAAILAFALLLLTAPPLQAQAPNYSLSGPTALTTNLMLKTMGTANMLATNAISTGIPIKLGVGLGVLAHYTSGQDTNTAPYWLNFQTSHNGTIWTSDATFSMCILARGTTNTYSFTNISPNVLDNTRYVRLWSVTQAGTNAIGLTNVYVMYKY